MAPMYCLITGQEWEVKRTFFRESYSPCKLCPRRCGANRENNNPGICQAGKTVKIASYNLHFGEEPPISGFAGSGTIFFSGCTMKCLFCQNYPISQLFNGEFYSVDDLAGIMLYLQDKGAHNINLVSPTPYLYHIATALYQAYRKGLRIPIVYNTSGYERQEIIRNLSGLLDIYLPDFKYHHDRLAQQLSGVKNYVENALPAIQEMFRQTGILKLDKKGIGQKGLMIRHLILPGQVKNSKEVLKTIAENGLSSSYLSLMSQYFPAHNACDSIVDRRITAKEYHEVKNYALELGFFRGWFQDI